MGFNSEKFNTTQFKDRVEAVPVPRLAPFFDLEEGEVPVWKVRGLTGLESAAAKGAVQGNQNVEAVLKALGSKLSKDIVAGVKELAGLHGVNDDKVPDELIKRHAWLQYGSVDPVCPEDMAVRLADNFPEDFYLLTNKILQLTGMGRVGESLDSGETK